MRRFVPTLRLESETEGAGGEGHTAQPTVRLTVVRLGPDGHRGFTLFICFDARWNLSMMFIF